MSSEIHMCLKEHHWGKQGCGCGMCFTRALWPQQTTELGEDVIGIWKDNWPNYGWTETILFWLVAMQQACCDERGGAIGPAVLITPKPLAEADGSCGLATSEVP